jgi:uncharacterized membrane protein YhaH (DUF805 family)
MALKFSVEWLVANLYFSKPFPLQAFLLPAFSVKEHYLGAASTSFLFFQILWSLPFMWIGVSMSVRRAVDAGQSALGGLLFLCPGLNYLIILLYSLLPSSSSELSQGYQHTGRTNVELSPHGKARLLAMLTAIVAGGIICLPVVFLSTSPQSAYSSALFLGLPTIMGSVASWMWNRDYKRSMGSSTSVAVSAVLLGSAFVLLFAIEGLLCMIMAAPFAAIGAVLGAPLGRYLAQTMRSRDGVAIRCCGVVALLLVASPLEKQLAESTALREVTTEIVVSAPPSAVWKHVVEFSEIAPPTQLLFRSGIAYPIRARIDGTGVGAIRHCEFSTGAFVEPITVWEPPYKLGFSVTSQPPTMTELSLYRNLEPRHLRETFVSHRGQFELIPIENGTRTLLKGTTWYSLAMSPQAYWILWTDFFIHEIHGRVLEHIKLSAE